jgi:uncharacterized protein YfdQ (DUF2303 family)
MEAAAIQRIEALAINSQDANKFHHRTDMPHALLLGDKVVSLENLRPERDRFRGTFKTRSLQAFVHYVKARIEEIAILNEKGAQNPALTIELTDSTVLFIDPEAFDATAIHNLGGIEEPGHCDDRSVLKLVKSPEWMALLAFAGQKHSQRDMADFLTDWRSIITPLFGGGGLITEAEARPVQVSAAIQALLNVKVDEKRAQQSALASHGVELSSFESVQLSSGGVELPTGFIFQLKPYEDLAWRAVTVVLTAYPADERTGIRMALRLVGLEELNKQMAVEFHELLRGQLDVPGFIGTFTP